MRCLALLLLVTACGASAAEQAPFTHTLHAYGDPTLCTECVFTDSCGFGERETFYQAKEDVDMVVHSDCPSGLWTFRDVPCSSQPQPENARE